MVKSTTEFGIPMNSEGGLQNSGKYFQTSVFELTLRWFT